jgi:hypothetical protein
MYHPPRATPERWFEAPRFLHGPVGETIPGLLFFYRRCCSINLLASHPPDSTMSAPTTENATSFQPHATDNLCGALPSGESTPMESSELSLGALFFGPPT